MTEFIDLREQTSDTNLECDLPQFTFRVYPERPILFIDGVSVVNAPISVSDINVTDPEFTESMLMGLDDEELLNMAGRVFEARAQVNVARQILTSGMPDRTNDPWAVANCPEEWTRFTYPKRFSPLAALKSWFTK